MSKRFQDWREKRERLRERERQKFAAEMSRVHGAPEGSELTPYDCVLLEQSIRGHGNEPPAWILSASGAWLAANGLSRADLALRGNK